MRSVVEENARDLLTYFARRATVLDDAADLVSETMLTAWRRVRDLPVDPQGARMWLFGIARRVLANYHRGQRRGDALAERLRLELAVAQTARGYLASNEQTEIRAAVAQLPPKLREITALVHWEGFTLTEAAQIIGIPASTARGRYATARAALRDLLKVDAVAERRGF
ncbi:RNA polymerase sigma factor [Cryobacterium sp. Y57]|uniref:RNA polymerase sigma factor n=1 Tax=Cryobacterium sp. Y57 TaxID=2048287 RepID=UPI001E309598|nr:sigma-70 family RNA polymerase sigma factor [Cryobacterium sp. Y57]